MEEESEIQSEDLRGVPSQQYTWNIAGLKKRLKKAPAYMAPMAMFQYHSITKPRIPQITITATATANPSNWQTSSVNKLCNLIKYAPYQDFSSARLEPDCWANWSLAITNAFAFTLLLLIFDNGTSNQPWDNLSSIVMLQFMFGWPQITAIRGRWNWYHKVHWPITMTQDWRCDYTTALYWDDVHILQSRTSLHFHVLSIYILS